MGTTDTIGGDELPLDMTAARPTPLGIAPVGARRVRQERELRSSPDSIDLSPTTSDQHQGDALDRGCGCEARRDEERRRVEHERSRAVRARCVAWARSLRGVRNTELSDEVRERCLEHDPTCRLRDVSPTDSADGCSGSTEARRDAAGGRESGLLAEGTGLYGSECGSDVASPSNVRATGVDLNMPGDGDHTEPAGELEGASMRAMGRGATDPTTPTDERGAGWAAEEGRTTAGETGESGGEPTVEKVAHASRIKAGLDDETSKPMGESGSARGGGGDGVARATDETTAAGTRRRKRRGRRTPAASQLPGHARFLQHLFRSYRRLRPGGWGKAGGLRGAPMPWRSVTHFRCRGGRTLAPPDAWEQQRALAAEVLFFYQRYVGILRRLTKRAPASYHPFCCEGGDAEGVRRAGGVPHGSDAVEQPRFAAWFGDESWRRIDASVRNDVQVAIQRARPVVVMASPPCKVHSTTNASGASESPDMIGSTRVQLTGLGVRYSIENVKGAARELGEGRVLMYGSDFGLGAMGARGRLGVDRPRFFEANFPVRIDEALREGGSALRRGSCLGPTRRWCRMDPFGRPELTGCCDGNIVPIQGVAPVGVTVAESAAAMDIDAAHMSYGGLSQAIPPAYGQMVFAQACMDEACVRFGVPRWTFDDYRDDPDRVERDLAMWERGAGEADPTAGLRFESAVVADEPAAAAPTPTHEAGVPEADVSEGDGQQASGSVTRDETRGGVVGEVEFREVFYSAHGGFDTVWRPDALCHEWTERILRGGSRTGVPSSGALRGRCSFVEPRRDELTSFLGEATDALLERGTQIVVQVRKGDANARKQLSRAGFALSRWTNRGEPTVAHGATPASLPHAVEWWAAGRRRSTRPGFAMDLDVVEAAMDPRDRGLYPKDEERVRMRSYLPIDTSEVDWEDSGLPASVIAAMREGLRIEPVDEPPPADHPFYPWETDEHLRQAISEADRHLLLGSMEYVPDDLVEEVAASSIVHPWVVVKQGGKWRLCHDYSCGTNKHVPTAPFGLPAPWDVRHVLKPSSFMAKYDIRDGFFHVPVHPDSRKRLVVRHPGTGRLMWARSLPFGYVGSPQAFCALMEGIADKLRKRVAGRGIHFFCYVDDWLCVGDTEALTREGCAMLEAELMELGIQVAPHKHRGPTQALEFLGLLISNVEGNRGMSLTRKRRDETVAMLDDWLLRRRELRAARGANPLELARLLGKLVFASQVVWNGRPYMQAMLSCFAGCSVDWKRGTVEFDGVKSRTVQLGAGFWRDIEWWRDHVVERYSMPFGETEEAEAVISGTDASGWGTGQLAWLDGAREEAVLAFTQAEQRRPINWRELLGVVRVVQIFGPRLEGRLLLLETDNMAAKGAAARRSSKATDMQELVRRLVDVCEQHRIRLRLTHTPGAKLDRPDQTSRGDPVEEPRQRLEESRFGALSRRWGPFNGFLGPERTHREAVAQAGVTCEGGDCLWVHPTFNTVGSSLRLLGNRARRAIERGERFRAVALVPDDPTAGWWRLTKHFAVAGRVPGRAGVWQKYERGGWTLSGPSRDRLVLIYPRAAGPRATPLVGVSTASVATVGAEGAFMKPERPCRERPDRVYQKVREGSYVYSPGVSGGNGNLLQLTSDWGEGAAGLPVVVEARSAYRVSTAASNRAKVASWDIGLEDKAYMWAAEKLWLVDHLVSVAPPAGRRSAFVRLKFDWRAADDEIAAARGAMGLPSDTAWVLITSEDGEHSEPETPWVKPGGARSDSEAEWADEQECEPISGESGDEDTPARAPAAAALTRQKPTAPAAVRRFGELGAAFDREAGGGTRAGCVDLLEDEPSEARVDQEEPSDDELPELVGPSDDELPELERVDLTDDDGPTARDAAVEPAEPACRRRACPCTSTFNGMPDEFCCWTCQRGTPCKQDFHPSRRAVLAAAEAAGRGGGGTARGASTAIALDCGEEGEAEATPASTATLLGSGSVAPAVGRAGISPMISPGAYVPFEMAPVVSPPREPASAPTPLRMGPSRSLALQLQLSSERRRASGGTAGPQPAPNLYAATPCWGCEGAISEGRGCTFRGRVLHDRESCRVRADARFEARRQAALMLEELEQGAPTADAGASTPAPTVEMVTREDGRRDTREVRGAIAAARQGAATTASPPVAFSMGSMASSEPFSMAPVMPGPARPSAQPAVRDGDLLPKVGPKGSSLLATRTAEAFSAQRRASIRLCLDGKCGRSHHGPSESVHVRPPTPCKAGCGRSLHVAECGGFGSGRALGSLVLCAYCRVKEMAPEAEGFPSETLERWAMTTMINEIASGAESSAAGFADIDQLEKRWAGESGVEKIVLPRHGAESFKNFWTWIFRDAGRARSADALWRQYNVLFNRLELLDLTKEKDVKVHYVALLKKSGVTHTPKGSCTPMMLKLLCHGIAQQSRSSELVAARDALLYAVAGLGGPRIGEQADCGQGHGITCSDMTLWERPDGVEVVELMVRTSKTGFARFVPIAGATRSGIQLAQLLRSYWKLAGFTIVGGSAGRYRYWRPSRMVLRVSLAGADLGVLSRLDSTIARCGNASARLNAKTTLRYAKERIKASGPGSESKKFVNVAMGDEKGTQLGALAAVIEQGTGLMASVAEAPMFMATEGRYQTLMPISSASLFDGVKHRLARAAQEARAAGDPQLNMTQREIDDADWASHSFRRGADKQARIFSEKEGISIERVDMSFGWNQRAMAKDMQLRYDENDLDKRMAGADITSVHITSTW